MAGTARHPVLAAVWVPVLTGTLPASSR